MKFYKYHGTGNDFVLINQYSEPVFDLPTDQITKICSRRFGVGADGLILLRKHPDLDFEMIYYNADGKESSMCGNGGRCIIQFAFDLGIIKSRCLFEAIDGMHRGEVTPKGIRLQMNSVSQIEMSNDRYILNTGSPHLVFEVDTLSEKTIFRQTAQKIRYNERFRQDGINVNSYQVVSDNVINGITYERGVEDITWSCGTGVVAMAIAYLKKHKDEGTYTVHINNLGGQLTVDLSYSSGQFIDIELIGPAEKVFEGLLEDQSIS